MIDEKKALNGKAIQRLLSRAYFYLRFRFRTEKEMTLYLSQKAAIYSYSSFIVEEAMRELQVQGFINDYRFVESYVLSHLQTRPKSAFLLKNELRRKGINEEIIADYFAKNPLNEENVIKETLTKRWGQYSHLDKMNRFKKAHDSLRRKGFAYGIVKKTIEEMEEKR